MLLMTMTEGERRLWDGWVCEACRRGRKARVVK